MWEEDINIYDIKEIRCKTNIYFGVGAINKIDDILKQLKNYNVNNILVVSGKNAYKSTGAWDVVENALINNNINFVNYSKVTPNPTVDHINEAFELGIQNNCNAVIGIGGGSAIDTAKSVAILLENRNYNASDLFTFKFEPKKACPIVAINLTHGTGTEANRFAVATVGETQFKPAIAYDCIYPFASIDDPSLMTKLSKEQTLYVSIDAINHAVEAATSKVASPFAISLAYETINLVSKFLPKILENPDCLKSRYFLLYASLLGGIAFDNGLLHLTHALEHPLSGIKHELTHGLGLAILLPSVIKYSYAQRPNIFKYILSPIVKDIQNENIDGEYLAKEVEKWLFQMGCKSKLKNVGFDINNVDDIVNLTFNTPSLDLLLSLSPIEANKDLVRKIFIESLEPYCK